MQNDRFNLQGKRALITGSSRGIGLTLARGLSEAGASVIINGRNKKTLDAVRERLMGEGINVETAVFDVSVEKSVVPGIQRIISEIGPVDILVNNAGVQVRGALENISDADWRHIIDTNLTGAFLTAREVVKNMIERKSGKIINICSVMSEVARKNIGPYTAAKGGLKMLTRSMATEWAEYNIQVNAIGPGYFMTEMTRDLANDKEFSSWIENRTPAHRWGRPEELVGPAVFLASEASSFVNGQIIYVDGGVLSTI